MADSEEKKVVRRPARPRALRPGDAGYDAVAARELKRRRRRVDAYRAKADELTWRIGMEYLVMRDKRLYLQAGYTSWSDFVVRGLGRSRDYVNDRIRIAESYVLAHVRKHGLDLLEDASRYAELSVADDAAWTPDSLEISVPVGDTVRVVPFRKASAEDLEAAIGHQLKLLAAREEAALPEAVKKGAEHVQKTLQVSHSQRSLADVRVRAADSGLAEDARLTLALRYGDLRAVILQLARALLGASDPARGRP